jgi:hypothetical protein
MIPHRLVPFLAPAFAVLTTLSTATAQCATSWITGSPAAGVAGDVYAITSWDPDGAGPAPLRLVVAGQFRVAGPLRVHNIAAFDPASGQWSAFGSGMDGPVHSLAVTAAGELVAGGHFDIAGGNPCARVARWTGTAWAPLGAGLPSAPSTAVDALAVLPTGEIVAAGSFVVGGPTPLRYLARWTGTGWSPMGNPDAALRSLLVLPNGDLVAGGWFTAIGGVAAASVARWDGSTWSALGTGLGGSAAPVAFSLARASNGDIVAGGQFTTAGGLAANGVARWNGNAWSPLGAGVSANVYGVAVLANGDVIAGGNFGFAAGLPVNCVARWDGSSWSGLGTGVTATIGFVYCVHATGNAAWVGGFLFDAGGVGTQGIARWEAGAWSSLGTGFSDVVITFASSPDGGVVAGGAFLGAPGIAAARVARFDGARWLPLGTGMDDRVLALLRLPNGDIVAGGSFTTAGGIAANGIARWDGTAWTPLGSGCNGAVGALTRLPNGDLVAAGDFTSAGGASAANIARWDGTTWSPLGAGVNGPVGELVVLPDGRLVAGGWFTHAGGSPARGIAQWDGLAWSAIGGSMNGFVHALAVLENGDLVAGGTFVAAGGVPCFQIARWNGAAWSPMGNGDLGQGASVDTIVPLPDGGAVVGGRFPGLGGGFPVGNSVSRWHANTWTPFGSGIDYRVVAMAGSVDGSVFVGGLFATANDQPAVNFARLATNCPARAVRHGRPCAGPAGSSTLVAESLPWLGGAFRGTTTNVPANALVVAVSGFATTSLPLAAVLPQGLPGCTLLATPDVLQLVLPGNSAARARIDIPPTAALVGANFVHQHIVLGLDLLGNLLTLSGSNALVLTVGRF